MRFRSFDHLRVLNIVARHLSFTAAAKELHLTKGAVSYQITSLERELDFLLFDRNARGIGLTEKGRELVLASQAAFDNLEGVIDRLRQQDTSNITIGMSTYFASRWLSPRLMTFMASYPAIGLRIQPLIDLTDLRANRIDMAIRWGKGDWQDAASEIERVFLCPAKPTAGRDIARLISQKGLEFALANQTLLHDRDGSSAWRDWYRAANLPYPPERNHLVIPDPNVRVQAVIDNQGIALNDILVANELSSGLLFQISEIELTDYGYYLIYPQGRLKNPPVTAFRDWILSEARQ